MPTSDMNPCNEPGHILDLNIDGPPPFCRDREVDKDGKPILKGQKDITNDRDLDWLVEETSRTKMGSGSEALCDPMQKGHIINEQGMAPPDRNTLYRYAKSLRGTDEAMMDLFRDLVVIDEDGKALPVPIMWATQEKAVAAIIQTTVRKDESLVVDRVRLPMLAINASGYSFNQDRYVYHKAIDYLRTEKTGWKPGFTKKERYERDTIFGVAKGIPIDVNYTLYGWTLYREDMNQILTQIITKFSPIAYIRVRGISWEIGVKLDSISNNVDVEPGDQNDTVYKFEFGFTAESFVSQPIVRKKAVLKTKIDVVDAIEDEDITEVLSKLESAVKELEE